MGKAPWAAALTYLVFNHHSLPFATREQAEQQAPGLLLAMIKARTFGYATLCVTDAIDSSLHRVELSQGYFWSDWLKTTALKPENRELRLAFLSLATAIESPFRRNSNEPTDCRITGSSARLEALGAAHELDTPLASHATRQPWHKSRLRVSVESLSKQGELSEQQAQLLNIHSIQSLEELRQELTARRDRTLNDGREIWARRATIYPNLDFCPHVQGQLSQWQYGAAQLAAVRDTLDGLNRFAADWQAGKYSQYTHSAVKYYVGDASDESPTVAKTPRLRKARVFRLDSGATEYFPFHVKQRRFFRLHYLPIGALKRICIGYVGKHLPLS